MTPAEIKTRTDDKVKEIKDLCDKLHIVLQAEEVVMSNGMIRKIVYFVDNEEYKNA